MIVVTEHRDECCRLKEKEIPYRLQRSVEKGFWVVLLFPVQTPHEKKSFNIFRKNSHYYWEWEKSTNKLQNSTISGKSYFLFYINRIIFSPIIISSSVWCAAKMLYDPKKKSQHTEVPTIICFCQFAIIFIFLFCYLPDV